MSLQALLIAPGFLLFMYAITLIRCIRIRLCQVCYQHGNVDRDCMGIRITDGVQMDSSNLIQPLASIAIDRLRNKCIIANNNKRPSYLIFREISLSHPGEEESITNRLTCICTNVSCRIDSTSDKPILVLDLDETLIHAVMDRSQIKMNPDSFTRLTIKECGINVWVSVHPGCKEFLEILSHDYELVLWTAGTEDYAQTVLGFIDPTGLLKHSLFRQHYTFVTSSYSGRYYAKDLSRLECNLDKLTIVDNSPLSFSFHPDKGIQVKDYIGSADDNLLVELKESLRLSSSISSICDNINLNSVTVTLDDNPLVCGTEVVDDKNSIVVISTVAERDQVDIIAEPCRKKPRKRASRVCKVPSRRSERLARKNPRRSPRLLARRS